jgi:RNA recognition motif-containing protein
MKTSSTVSSLAPSHHFVASAPRSSLLSASSARNQMTKRDKSIYVGNLPWGATESQVQTLFGEYGPVLSVKIMTDRDTGKPRGFCFVEMGDADADKAISSLNGHSFLGRNLRVDGVRPKPQKL